MPRIPGVPTLEPVNLPMMSPSEAGKVGAAVSEVGEASNDVALTGLAIDYHIREAQKNVDAIAAQNDYAVADAQYQTALSKTTNSRDVADVTKQAQDNLNEIAKRWEKSPALVEIQQAGDKLRPRIDHLGTMKTIDLQEKEWDVQTDIQLQTLIPQLVTAQRNGDKAQTDYIHGYIDNIFENGKKSGLITEADKELALNKTQIQFRKQLNESYISSADAKERLGAIQQLKSGGSGPLDLSGLAPGDVAALRIHAEETNRTINNLTEAQDLNKNLNVVQNAFQSPEFKNNYEARINALQDGDWLTKHGVVAQDGSPDRVMAEKLIAETNRQRGEWEKERDDRDEKALVKLDPMIALNQVSRGQLVQIAEQEKLSPRAYTSLLAKFDENVRFNKQMALQNKQVALEERQQKSADTKAEVRMNMMQGHIYDPVSIRMMPGLTKSDQAELLGDAEAIAKSPQYRGALTMISDTVPLPSLPKNATPQQRQDYAEANKRQIEQQNETFTAFQQRKNEHPEESFSESADAVLKPVIQQQIADHVRQIFGLPEPPPPKRDATKGVIGAALSGFGINVPSLFSGGSTSKPATATPKDSAVQTFKVGSTVYHIPADKVNEFLKDNPNAAR